MTGLTAIRARYMAFRTRPLAAFAAAVILALAAIALAALAALVLIGAAEGFAHAYAAYYQGAGRSLRSPGGR